MSNKFSASNRSGSKRVVRSLSRLLLTLAMAGGLTACESLGLDGQRPGAGRPVADAATFRGAPADDQTPAEDAGSADTASDAQRFVRRGTGIFINPNAVAQPSITTSAENRTAINFRDAPLATVVQAILGDILDLPYAIDPSIQGNISLQTSDDLPRDALIPILEGALRLNGLVLFRTNGIYQIAPSETVARNLGVGPVYAAPGRGDPGFGISVIPLRYASALEVDKLIRPFLNGAVTVQADANRNLFLVAGSGPARANTYDLIKTFDVDWMAGMSMGMFPLQTADAVTVAEELQTILLGETASMSGIIRFVPVERLNSVLVITHEASYLEMIEEWIDRLDRGAGQTDGRSLHVYRIQNGRATDLAFVLSQLFDATPQAARGGQVSPGLEPKTISTSGFQSNTGTAQEPTVVQRSAPAINGFSTGEGGLRIIADDTNNALVILGTESDHRLIRSALRDLDVAPLQVLIEATIAEVTLTDELRFGLQWFFNSGNSDVTLSSFSDGTVGPVFPGFNYVFDNNSDVRIVLDALEDITDVQIISSPQLMVLNNHSALLQVGDQVPVAVRSSVSTLDDTAPVVNSIEFKDTGVILRVTPRVNAGGLVMIEIEQEVSSVVSTTTSGIDSPTIQQRRIKSTVAVRSGETVALGGLIQEKVQRRESGIPYLSRIPILGNLFKTNKDINIRTELLILITPRVIANFEEAREVTAELRSRLHAIEGMTISTD
ncbi:MAG: type II secretion system secretin GspD [Proteobacteria bacterium]|nr:type II secretion system secretin GspD [Pseudomonadota bacterium]